MMNMHDRYYEEPDDDGEQIEQEIDDLLKNENNPYTSENILQALVNDALMPSIETLATLLEKGDTAAAGVVLSARLYTYCEERTRDEVLGNL